MVGGWGLWFTGLVLIIVWLALGCLTLVNAFGFSGSFLIWWFLMLLQIRFYIWLIGRLLVDWRWFGVVFALVCLFVTCDLGGCCVGLCFGFICSFIVLLLGDCWMLVWWRCGLMSSVLVAFDWLECDLGVGLWLLCFLLILWFGLLVWFCWFLWLILGLLFCRLGD